MTTTPANTTTEKTDTERTGKTIRAAVIGASFASQGYLPAMRVIPDVEVVAIASARLENAQRVAQQFGIPHAYDDWRAMLDAHDLDLVGVVTPPVYHCAMTLAALERGAHVICEKPMAMHSGEAQHMLDTAERLGRRHLIGHELRFNPNRRKIRDLIRAGYIGKVYHMNVTNISTGYGDPASRVYNDWWAMQEMGGGRLGANGSHQIDLIRFFLGEIGAVSGQLATMIPNRIGKDNGQPWTATADDQCSFTLEMQSGALATVFISTVARHGTGNSLQIYGSEGTIRLADADEKLMVARAGEDFQDMSEDDPNAALPGVLKGVWNVSFVGLMQEFTAAIREGRAPREGATFADGLKCQQAMDAVRQSWAERRWITLG